MKQIFLFTLLAALVGCHQDPAVPDSIIPATCQLGMIETINEGAFTRLTTFYNPFGSIVKQSYQSFENQVIKSGWDAEYSYDADRYLISYGQTPTGTGTPVRETYSYEGDPKRLRQAQRTGPAGSQTTDYTYAGNNVSAITVKTSAGTSTYTFGTDGRLTSATVASVSAVSVSGGKIRQQTYPNGTSVNYEYDTDGQLLRRDSSWAGGNKIQENYTYDKQPFAENANLRQRGWPIVDLGYRLRVNNDLTFSRQRFTNGVQTGQEIYRNQHEYNKGGYSRGFSVTDGYRTKYYYTNCP